MDAEYRAFDRFDRAVHDLLSAAGYQLAPERPACPDAAAAPGSTTSNTNGTGILINGAVSERATVVNVVGATTPAPGSSRRPRVALALAVGFLGAALLLGLLYLGALVVRLALSV